METVQIYLLEQFPFQLGPLIHLIIYLNFKKIQNYFKCPFKRDRIQFRSGYEKKYGKDSREGAEIEKGSTIYIGIQNDK